MPETLTGESVALQAFLNDPLLKIYIRLAQNAIPDDPDLLSLGSLTEANFAGYAALTDLDWEIIDSAGDDVAQAFIPDATFVAGDNVTPQAITALYVTTQYDDNAPQLRGVFPFAQPYVIDTPGQAVTKEVVINFYEGVES